MHFEFFTIASPCDLQRTLMDQNLQTDHHCAFLVSFTHEATEMPVHPRYIACTDYLAMIVVFKVVLYADKNQRV